MRSLAWMLASIACAPALAAQSVLVVDTNQGPGWEYATIQSAVNAAQDGDIVLVRAGIYYDESLKIIGKGVTVSADAGAEVLLTEGVRIESLAAGQTAVLRGLRIEPDTWPFNIDKFGLLATACSGAIRIEDCTLIATWPTGKAFHAWEGAWVSSCDSVVLTDCLVKGGPPAGFGDGHGGIAFMALGSRVALFGCQLLGHDAFSAAPGGDAAYVQSSAFYAAGVEFTGGAPETGFAWGRGLYALQSDATVLDCVFAPPGAGGDIVLELSTLLSLPGSRHVLETNAPVREGQSLQLALEGVAGEGVSLLVALDTLHQFVPAHEAPLLVLPSPAIFVPVGTVALDGTLAASFLVPPLPAAFEGLALPCQAVFSAPGELSLSNPASLIVLDASL